MWYSETDPTMIHLEIPILAEEQGRRDRAVTKPKWPLTCRKSSLCHSLHIRTSMAFSQ